MAQAYEADIIIIPGGPGARKENLPLHILEFLIRAGDSAEIIASVCTGAFILAKAGLADGHQMTTHAAQTDTLARLYPKIYGVKGPRVVSGGSKLLSSAGISVGIDLAWRLSPLRRQRNRPLRREAPGMARPLVRSPPSPCPHPGQSRRPRPPLGIYAKRAAGPGPRRSFRIRRNSQSG